MKNISYERYVETFQVLESRSGEYEQQLEHLLRSTSYLNDGFSILDIGAGKGDFAASFINGAKARAGVYTAIEPSVDQIAMIRKNLAEFTGKVEIINESFTPEFKLGKKFDLIIMSHSIYWFYEDVGAYLKNVVRHLQEGGKAIVYMQTFATFSYILNTFLRAGDPPYPHRLSCREVTPVLDEMKARYKVDYLPGALNADDVLRPENKKLLHDLISFCLFAEALNLSAKDLKFAEDLLRLLSYEKEGSLKLNLTLAAIKIEH